MTMMSQNTMTSIEPTGEEREEKRREEKEKRNQKPFRVFLLYMNGDLKGFCKIPNPRAKSNGVYLSNKIDPNGPQ